MTSGNSGHSNQAHIIHFRPFIDPDDQLRHDAYVGQRNTFTFLWVTPTTAEVYIHDEVTPGG